MIWLAQKNTTRKPEEQEKNYVKEKEKGKGKENPTQKGGREEGKRWRTLRARFSEDEVGS
jgi:hypothetical protein